MPGERRGRAALDLHRASQVADRRRNRTTISCAVDRRARTSRRRADEPSDLRRGRPAWSAVREPDARRPAARPRTVRAAGGCHSGSAKLKSVVAGRDGDVLPAVDGVAHRRRGHARRRSGSARDARPSSRRARRGCRRAIAAKTTPPAVARTPLVSEPRNILKVPDRLAGLRIDRLDAGARGGSFGPARRRSARRRGCVRGTAGLVRSSAGALAYCCPPSAYSRYNQPVSGLYDGAWKFVPPPSVG